MNKTLKIILQSVIIAVMTVLIIGYFYSHSSEWKLLLEIPLSFLFLLSGLILTGNAVHSLQLYCIVKELNLKNMPFWTWFKIYTVSRFINFHITQGANIYRGIKLKKEYGFSYTQTLSLITFASWLNILMMTGISTLLLILTPVRNRFQSAAVYTLLIIFCAVWIIPLIFHKLVRTSEKSNIWILARFHQLSSSVIQNIRNRKLLRTAAGLGLIHFSIYIIATYVGFHALRSAIGLTEAALFTTLLLIMRIIHIVPGNFGVTEVVCGQFTALLGLSLGSGLLVAGLYRILGYGIVFVLTIIFIKTIFVNNEIAAVRKEVL